MSVSAKQIIDQALELSEQDRAFVAEQLLLSLSAPDPAIDKGWVLEAEARLDAYRRGELQAVSLREVFAKYKAE
jgi:hypothetical protein